MYIGIDIGGTKTLICTFTNEGQLSQAVKFPTPKNYPDWLTELKSTLSTLSTTRFRAGCVAVPGAVDRKNGVITSLGNLKWKNIPIIRDVQKEVLCPLRIENDAKLAGLSEATMLKDEFSRVLYVTISTGIGFGLTVNGVIDEQIGDGGGKTMLLEHRGKMLPWESFASGKAIFKKYGKMAGEIEDKSTWKEIVRTFSPGFLELIAILEPEVIVVGGGAGQHLSKFHDLLKTDLEKYETPMLSIPPIIGAKRPNEAVVYGCFEYAHQIYR